MSWDIRTIRKDAGIFDAIQQMKAAGVRRMPIVDGGGRLVGLLTIDDLIRLLAREMADIARIIGKEGDHLTFSFFMIPWTVFGVIAAFLTMFGFVPQIVQMYRRKLVHDVSVLTLYQFAAGVALWTVYGYAIGGVGEHDLVRRVLEASGGDLRFWRVAMRPGAPLGFGVLHGVPWIGLPGNPVSTMVTFELFVRPAIRRLAGHPLPFRRTVPVTLREPITLGPRLRHFLRAVVTTPRGPDGGWEAVLTGPQGSGILTSMVKANALVIVPADRPAVAAGERLDALLLDDPEHLSEPTF